MGPGLRLVGGAHLIQGGAARAASGQAGRKREHCRLRPPPGVASLIQRRTRLALRPCASATPATDAPGCWLGRREDLLKGDLARQPKLLRIDRTVLRNPHRGTDGVIDLGEGLDGGFLDDYAVAVVLIQLRLHAPAPRGRLSTERT